MISDSQDDPPLAVGLFWLLLQNWFYSCVFVGHDHCTIAHLIHYKITL